jgi:hypothetical protein
VSGVTDDGGVRRWRRCGRDCRAVGTVQDVWYRGRGVEYVWAAASERARVGVLCEKTMLGMCGKLGCCGM